MWGCVSNSYTILFLRFGPVLLVLIIIKITSTRRGAPCRAQLYQHDSALPAERSYINTAQRSLQSAAISTRHSAPCRTQLYQHGSALPAERSYINTAQRSLQSAAISTRRSTPFMTQHQLRCSMLKSLLRKNKIYINN